MSTTIYPLRISPPRVYKQGNPPDQTVHIEPIPWIDDIWVDTTNHLVKRCTSMNPYVWVSIEGGGGSGPTIEVNGTAAGSQSLLNLVAGTGITITDNGSGSITFAATGTGSITVATYHVVAASGNNTGVVKASAGNVYGWSVYNNAGYPVYVKLFNKATTPSPGSDTVVQTISAQAGVGDVEISSANIAFSTGIGIAIVKGIADSDNTSVVASDCVVDIFYA